MDYTVQAVERATGVAGSRLRTWERRYGVPVPPRSATGRRLYTEADVQLIRRMAALIDSGISVAQAADAVRTGEAWEPPAPPATERVVSPLAERLLEAARALDDAETDRVLTHAVDELHWGPALDDVVFPALRRAGEEWANGQFSVAQEHLLSEVVRLRIDAAAALAGFDPRPATLVMACPDGEFHDLALAGLRLLLRQAGVPVSYLGASVPTPALVDAVTRLEPEAVLLCSTSTVSVPTMGLAARQLLSSGWRGHVFFGGAGVRGAAPLNIPGTRLPERLQDAASMVRTHLEPRA